MAYLKRSNSLTTLPPSYQEHKDIELGSVYHAPGRVQVDHTGRTTRGGYRDYEPNAPHDPNKVSDSNDQLMPKKPKDRKMLVSIWHICILYGIIILLVALVALCAGFLFARQWLEVRTELVINGATINDTTLRVKSDAPSIITITTTHRETFTQLQTTVETVTSTPRPTVTKIEFQTFTKPGITEVVTNTKTTKIASAQSVTPATSDPGMSLVIVTPSTPVVTSMTVITTTLPASAPPPVTRTTIIADPNGTGD